MDVLFSRVASIESVRAPDRAMECNLPILATEAMICPNSAILDRAGPTALFVDQTGQLGGAELSLLDIARRISVPLAVCIFEEGPFADCLRAGGIETVVLGAGRSFSSIRKAGGRGASMMALPATARLVMRVAKLARRFDVVYANTQKAFVIAAVACAIARRPLIWHLHDILSAEHFSALKRRLVITLANRLAGRVIANSQATADSFVAGGGRVDLLEVVPNGIESIPFNAASETDAAAIRRSLGLDREPLLGVFGRLAPWKGQQVAVEALSRLPGMHLAIVGDALFGEGDVKRRFLELIEAHDVCSRVHFLGFRSDVPVLMKACDLILHTSTAPEPFGRVIVEAMLAGRPVIATNAGGAREIVEQGVSGLLVEPNDPAALAAAVQLLVEDPAFAKRLATAGRARAVSQYDPATIVSAIHSIIIEAASRRPRKAESTIQAVAGAQV